MLGTQRVLYQLLRFLERILKVSLLVVLLHAQLNLSDRVHVIRTSVFFLKVLVDYWSRPQGEDGRLSLDKVLNQDGAVDEFEEDEGYIEHAA